MWEGFTELADEMGNRVEHDSNFHCGTLSAKGGNCVLNQSKATEFC